MGQSKIVLQLILEWSGPPEGGLPRISPTRLRLLDADHVGSSQTEHSGTDVGTQPRHSNPKTRLWS